VAAAVEFAAVVREVLRDESLAAKHRAVGEVAYPASQYSRQRQADRF
jgi:hypothetical protein